MTPIKTILVPTDFSEPAAYALSYAVELAEKLGAKVLVVHSWELPIVGFPDGVLVPTADVAAHFLTACGQAIDDLIAPYRSGHVEVSRLLRQGDPRSTVLVAAAETGADLIVMGTHGRRGLSRALLGSVTERLIRTSPVPILSVHADTSVPARRRLEVVKEVAR